MDNALVEIARILLRMRQSRGWSPETLAQRAGVPVDTIRAYEADPSRLSAKDAIPILDAMPPVQGDELSPSLGPPPQSVLNQMEARMQELEAAMRIDQRRFRDALELLDRALGLLPSRDRRGRLLLSRAIVLGELSREEKALQALREAESCLSPAHEPALWLRLRLEQMYFLCQMERYQEAEACQKEVSKLAARVGRDRERLQARWMSGWIAAGSGRTEEALRTLRPVRQELLAAGRLVDSAGVALDLAGLLARAGELAEVAELRRELEPLMREKSLSNDARTAIKVFCWAVERGRLDEPMGRRLAAELRRGGGRLMRPYEIPV